MLRQAQACHFLQLALRTAQSTSLLPMRAMRIYLTGRARLALKWILENLNLD